MVKITVFKDSLIISIKYICLEIILHQFQVLAVPCLAIGP